MDYGYDARLKQHPNLVLIKPNGYLEFMQLLRSSKFVVTDSGGIQEETTYLGIPCLTLRDTTERPITVAEGTNRLVRPDELEAAVERVLAGEWPSGSRPSLWDGQTAGRVVKSCRFPYSKSI